MTASPGPFPTYKDSGIPPLSHVPKHWDLRPLKYAVRMNAEVLSETTPPTYEFRYIDIGAVGTGFLVQVPERILFGDAPSRARRIVRAGDTIISTVRTYLKAVYFVADDAADLVCSTGFAVLTPTARVVPRFLQYLVQSDPFTSRVTAESVGIAYPAIAETRLGSFDVPLPPLDEQGAIVRYLDHMDRRIRRYIRAKQKLIKLLEEEKQAIIHRAVTGQVDVRTGQPYPAYKPSGVEWLGEVPEGWEVAPIGRFARVGNGSTPSRSNMAYWDGGTYPWLNSSSVHAGLIQDAKQFVTSTALRECHLPIVPRGSVLIAITGQGKTRGTAAVLDLDATINQHIAYITCRSQDHGWTPDYLQLTLTAAYHELRRLSDDSGSTKGALTCETMRHFKIPMPAAEQLLIVAFIRNQTSRADAAIAKCRQEIQLLREYRTRLIADVVTGKLDVREAAAQLPDEPDEDEPMEEAALLEEVIGEDVLEAEDDDA